MNNTQRRSRGPLFDQQFLAGLSGGLSGAPSGGFFGGLFQGLSGSLRGIQMYQAGTHEEERQRIRDMIEERRYQERMAIENQRLGLEQRRVAVAERPDAGAAQPDLLRISEADWPTYMSRYQSIHPGSDSMDPFERFKAEAQYKAAHPELFPSEGFGQTETEVLQYDALGRPLRTRSWRTSGKRPGLPVNEKLARETAALNQSDNPDELLKVSFDSTLEPETRRAAAAKRIRLMSAGTPSQVR